MKTYRHRLIIELEVKEDEKFVDIQLELSEGDVDKLTILEATDAVIMSWDADSKEVKV